MTDTTRHLGLPLLAAAQAQKHVTHNEALTALDALVQLACLDKDLAGPPGSPAEGDRYLVASAAPTGAWAGLSGQIARYEDGVWVGAAPRPGWIAYLVDEGDLYVYTGGAWASLRAALNLPESLPQLGVNTASDPVNRLAVKSEAVLLTWDDRTPGPGNLRQTLNRRASANDCGLVLQTGYATRALVGNLADDDLLIKVSPDGSAFYEGLRVRAGSGLAAFPNLLAPAARDSAFVGPAGALSVDAANRRLVLHDGATPGGIPAARLDEVGKGGGTLVHPGYRAGRRYAPRVRRAVSPPVTNYGFDPTQDVMFGAVLAVHQRITVDQLGLFVSGPRDGATATMALVQLDVDSGRPKAVAARVSAPASIAAYGELWAATDVPAVLEPGFYTGALQSSTGFNYASVETDDASLVSLFGVGSDPSLPTAFRTVWVSEGTATNTWYRFRGNAYGTWPAAFDPAAIGTTGGQFAPVVGIRVSAVG